MGSALIINLLLKFGVVSIPHDYLDGVVVKERDAFREQSNLNMKP